MVSDVWTGRLVPAQGAPSIVAGAMVLRLEGTSCGGWTSRRPVCGPGNRSRAGLGVEGVESRRRTVLKQRGILVNRIG